MNTTKQNKNSAVFQHVFGDKVEELRVIEDNKQKNAGSKEGCVYAGLATDPPQHAGTPPP